MKSLGQIAYEAFAGHSGSTFPAWDSLKPETKQAWEHAADEVRVRCSDGTT